MRFLSILLLFCMPGAYGQVGEKSKNLSPPALRQDAGALRKALEKYHPGLYWYTTQEKFKQTWNSLSQDLERPLTEIEFFRLLLPVVAKVQCAHTLFYPSNDIRSNGLRFPIDVKVIGERIYLWPDSGNTSGIPKGSELLSINQTEVPVILEKLLPNLQAQGGNRGWKKVILENDFQNYYYYLIDQADRFDVRYIDSKTNTEQSKTLNGTGEEAFRKHWKNTYPENESAPLKITFVQDSVAIVTIKSLVRKRAKVYGQDFDQTIDRYFQEIKEKNVRRLIIDVRGNEGGNNPGKLYSYIATHGDRSPSNSKDAIAIKPAKNNFEGEVIVLANERSISAQETFVSIFKYYKRGPVVGRPTPGCYKGLCSGKKHKLVLPNSKFEILIPMHRSAGIHDPLAGFKEGEGFPPDYYFAESILDLIEGKDPAMTFAIELLGKMQ